MPAYRRATPNTCRPDALTGSRSEVLRPSCQSRPVHRPTSCGALRLKVPLANRGPTVHVTSAAGSTVTPDRKSSVDCTVSVTCELGRTRPRTEILIPAGTPATSGVASGSRPGTSRWSRRTLRAPGSERLPEPGSSLSVKGDRSQSNERRNDKPLCIQETKPGCPRYRRDAGSRVSVIG